MAANSGADDEDSDDDVIDAQLEKCFAHPKERSGGPRKWNGRADYTLVKQWVTGETATMEQEDIDRELFELARDWMWASKLKKTPGHKELPTDFAMWKQNRTFHKKKTGVTVTTYRCPLLHRCNCKAGIRIMRGPTFIRLDKLGVHDSTSHDEDGSKFLKYQQIVAVVDAVRTAPSLSAAELRRNLQMSGPDSPGKKIAPGLLRSIQNRVRTARVQLTTDQLAGYAINDSFGSLTKFAKRLDVRALIDQHNDPEHDFHFDLFSPIILGADIKAQRDLVYLQVSSPWFIFNVFRSMMAGWGTQLNADATFGFCRSNLDMIGLGVNSMGAHNNPLTWALIPHHGESEICYAGSYEHFQSAAIALLDVVTSDCDCEFCRTLNQIRDSPEVIRYVASEDHANGFLQITSAQCDNHQGFQNFARSVLELDPNICKNHVLGEKCIHALSELKLMYNIFNRYCCCKLQPRQVFFNT